MTCILVSGGQGQLAQALLAVSKGYLNSSALPNSPISLKLPERKLLVIKSRRELDITNPESIASALAQHQPNILINAAAYTAVDRAESEPDQAHLINGTGPGLLAQACSQSGTKLIHISTDFIFDGQSEQPYAEEATASPINVYGRSKLEGEQGVLEAFPEAVILRTSWVFSQFGNNFLKTMLRLGRERTELKMVADQAGGPSYAPHIAQVLLQLAERLSASKKGIGTQQAPIGIYHFAGQASVSRYEFAQEIFTQAVKLGLLSKAPVLIPIPTSLYPTPAKRPRQTGLQQDRLDALLGQDNIERDWRKGVENSLLSLKESQ